MIRLHEVDAQSRGDFLLQTLDARAKVIVTIAYIAVVLSFSLTSFSGILLFAVFPIVSASMSGISYGQVFLRSMIALPFIAFVGIFNPIFEREPMLVAGDLTISRGWVEFLSIMLRGVLTVQAALLLIASTGFQRVCRALGCLGVPQIFTTQLMLIYRYIYVLINEAIRMDRARRSRSYGRRHYDLSMWATFVGQLLVRSVGRAERIHRAMLARGFDGHVRILGHLRWSSTDTAYCILWIGLFIAGRFFDLSSVLKFL
ncbi:MAG: cobalt ECF transporter T component CbiQ [Duncaniella sp.]|nr:cobalt ECF transporter T component CbiQ [Duncaniella sp.]